MMKKKEDKISPLKVLKQTCEAVKKKKNKKKQF